MVLSHDPGKTVGEDAEESLSFRRRLGKNESHCEYRKRDLADFDLVRYEKKILSLTSETYDPEET